MKPITKAKTGTGSSAIIPMDFLVTPVSIGFGVVVTGTVNYTVQHTFDEAINSTPTNWFDHATIASQTATKTGSYDFPVTALRVTVNSGTGTASLTVLQAGISNG